MRHPRRGNGQNDGIMKRCLAEGEADVIFLALKLMLVADGTVGASATAAHRAKAVLSVGRGGMEGFEACDRIGLLQVDDTGVDLIPVHRVLDKNGSPVRMRDTKAEVVEILDIKTQNLVFLMHGTPLFFHIFIILPQRKNVNKKRFFSPLKAEKVCLLTGEAETLRKIHEICLFCLCHFFAKYGKIDL